MARSLSWVVKMGRKSIWSTDELDILAKNYSQIGDNIINLLPKKSLGQISSKARQLRLSSNKRMAWSKTEDEILINNYKTMGMSVLSLLKNRTAKSITSRAYMLGLRTKHKKGKLYWNKIKLLESGEFLEESKIAAQIRYNKKLNWKDFSKITNIPFNTLIKWRKSDRAINKYMRRLVYLEIKYGLRDYD
jgi:DNA-binding transcriptional regulator YiaG